MNVTLKIILVLFGLAYLISPADIIPDLLLPWVGWIDDSLVLWSVYYLIRYGKLPWFWFKKKARGGFPGKATKPGRKFSGPKQGKKTNPNPKPPPKNPRSAKTENPRSARNENPRSEKKVPKKTTPAGKTPHEILGVASDATWPQIQAAYKDKIKQYHPDKLSHLGEEFSTLANEKFLEIQAAYELLKQKSN